ncbi:ion channel [Pseudomonas aeruginosa]
MTLMLLFQRFGQWVVRRIGWGYLLVLLACHMAVSLLGMQALGEDHLTGSLRTFFYWYVTTTATVGYGDLSPKTEAGQLFTSLWVMMCGIALLAAFFGGATTQIVSRVIDTWRAKMKGTHDYNRLEQHTVVVGWVPQQTQQIVELLILERGGQDGDIVICADNLSENPLPAKAQFVRGESLMDANVLTRAGIEEASRIIVCTDSDEQTLAAVLSINGLKYQGHMVAHFKSPQSAALAKSYVPEMEVASSMVSEMLVRSAKDPGTSDVIVDLLGSSDGACLYSYTIDESMFLGKYSQVVARYFARTVCIGIRKKGQPGVDLCCDDVDVEVGDQIFYIAKQRLGANL